MKRPQRQQLIAMIVTLLFHLMIVVILMAIYLRYSPSAESERQWPPVDSSEILLGGEYVMVGEIPDIAPGEATPVAPEQETEIEVAAEPEVTTSAPVESPAKVTPSPATPTKPKVDPAAEARARQEQQTREQTASRVAGAFSPKTGDKPAGGQPDGNSNATFNTSGAPGVDLGGRTLASWVKAQGNATGTITIDVTVNREGKVTAASYNPGRSKGAVAANEAARNSCINAAKKCTFSRATDGPELQRGTISFRFK